MLKPGVLFRSHDHLSSSHFSCKRTSLVNLLMRNVVCFAPITSVRTYLCSCDYFVILFTASAVEIRYSEASNGISVVVYVDCFNLIIMICILPHLSIVLVFISIFTKCAFTTLFSLHVFVSPSLPPLSLCVCMRV